MKIKLSGEHEKVVETISQDTKLTDREVIETMVVIGYHHLRMAYEEACPNGIQMSSHVIWLEHKIKVESLVNFVRLIEYMDKKYNCQGGCEDGC